MNKIWAFLKKYKKTVIVVLIIIIGGIWYYRSTHTATATVYTVSPVTLGTIKTTVSGTGQVASSQEITINPQVSGTLTSINIKDGDSVTAGEVLATIDSTTAGFNLQNAQIALAKLESSNPVSVTSSENSVINASSSLAEAYTGAAGTIISTYNSINPIITGLNDIFYGKNASSYFTDENINQQTYGQTAITDKQTAGVLVDKVTAEYQNFQSTYLALSATSSTSTITAALTQETQIAEDLLAAVQNTSVAVNFIITSTSNQNRTSVMTTDQNNLSNWLSTMNTAAANLTSASNTIQNDQLNLAQNIQSTTQLETGSNPLDVQSAELSLQQAQYTYNEYTIRAPFAGIVGNVTLQKGDPVSGSSVIATLVTKQYISNIVLNEVDATKVSVGQPVSVTFNALPNVTATGTVTEVDTVGTVTQGVVSYNIQISFGTDNSEVKVGMSINASITTAEVDNVPIVPSAAIKTQGTRSYVQVPAGPVTPAATTAASAVGAYSRTGTASGTGAFTNGSSTGTSTGGYYRNRTASSTYAGSGTFAGGYISTSSASASRGGTATSVSNVYVQVGLTDNINTQIVSGLAPGQLVVTRTTTGSAASTASAASSGNILSSLGGGARTATVRTGGGGGFTGGGRGG